MKANMLVLALFSLIVTTNGVNAQESKVETSADKGMALMEAAKKAEKKEDPLKVEFDTDSLNKEFATDPKLSTDSFDQKDRNKKLAVIDQKFEANNLQHIQDLYLCQKMGTAKEAIACRKNIVKKSK